MELRLASPSELSILESLARQIWPQAYANIISPAQIEFMLNWMYSCETLQKQRAEGHEFYILALDGHDIGFIALEWAHVAHAVFKRQLKINKLYVLTDFQGKGAGRVLVEKATERALATACEAIFLHVNKANQAKNFYLQLGFQVREEAIFDIGNGFVMDDYIMEVQL